MIIILVLVSLAITIVIAMAVWVGVLREAERSRKAVKHAKELWVVMQQAPPVPAEARADAAQIQFMKAFGGVLVSDYLQSKEIRQIVDATFPASAPSTGFATK